LHRPLRHKLDVVSNLLADPETASDSAIALRSVATVASRGAASSAVIAAARAAAITKIMVLDASAVREAVEEKDALEEEEEEVEEEEAVEETAEADAGVSTTGHAEEPGARTVGWGQRRGAVHPSSALLDDPATHGYCVYSHADWSHACKSVEG